MGVSGVVGVSGFLANLADLASVICYAVAALGCGYALFAAWSARSFVRAAPLQLAANFPAVTILKPLHGAEPTLYGNLAGFCVQDYPGPVQIVFGVADAADPAIGIVRKLMADFPGFDFALVVSPASHGVNAKVSNLINMLPQRVTTRWCFRTATSSLRPTICDMSTAPGPTRRRAGDLPLSGRRSDTASGARLAAAAIDYDFLPSALVGLSSVWQRRALARLSRCAGKRSLKSAASPLSPIIWPTIMRLARGAPCRACGGDPALGGDACLLRSLRAGAFSP